MSYKRTLEATGAVLRKGSVNASTQYLIFEHFEDFLELVKLSSIKDIVYEEFFLNENCLVKQEHWKVEELEDFMKKDIDEHNETIKMYFTKPYCVKYFVLFSGKLYVYIDEVKNLEIDPKIFANKHTNPFYLERASLIGKTEDSEIIKRKIKEAEEKEDENIDESTVDLYVEHREKLKFTYLTLDFIKELSEDNKFKHCFTKASKKERIKELLTEKKYKKLSESYISKQEFTPEGEDFVVKCFELLKSQDWFDDSETVKSGVNAIFYDKRKTAEEIIN